MQKNTERHVNPEIDKLDHAICEFLKNTPPITLKVLETAWRCSMKDKIEAAFKHEIPWEMLIGYLDTYWESSAFIIEYRCLFDSLNKETNHA